MPWTDLDLRLIGGGELTHSYTVESGGEVKMTKEEIIEMIQRSGFGARAIRTQDAL